MLDAARDDRKLALPEVQGPVAKLDPQSALQHEEQFVLPLMVVPDEFPFHLHQFHVGIVQLRDDLRFPGFVNPIELRTQIHRLN